MYKNKEKQQNKNLAKVSKATNQFKALYKMTKQRRVQNLDGQIYHNENKSKSKILDIQATQRSKYVEDSLDNYNVDNQEEEQVRNPKKRITYGVGNKKPSHNRSHSCPFMNPPNTIIKTNKQSGANYKHVIEDQGKRTLKKSSVKHRKNKQNDHKFSIGHHSQISQQSNTVIVHSLPIQQLSSMLYSLNHDKQGSLKKVSSTSHFPKRLVTIHNDVYFQTRVQQQMKMYDLNQELKKLHKQTENVKIRQQVLEKLANRFDKTDGCTDEEQSLLIH